jgi:predicted SAM-dependent methyltransferase
MPNIPGTRGRRQGRKEGWVTIDITKNCDVFWDLRKGLPFPDQSITKIYSSHFFEHLSFKESQQLLDECRRVLVPGGTFSICVPNARLYIEAYLKSDSLVEKRFFEYKPAYNNTTRIDYVNYTAYMDGHISICLLKTSSMFVKSIQKRAPKII